MEEVIKLKEAKILEIGIAIFVACILISSATAVQVSNKDAVDEIEKNAKKNIIEELLDEDLNNIFDTIIPSDIDIESYLWILYNDQEFSDKFNELKTTIINSINNNFPEDKRPLVEQLFHIEETFNFDSLANRINSINYDSEQLMVFLQEKLEVASDLNELEDGYENEAKILLEILYEGDGKPDPESAGLHNVINNASYKIQSIYRILIEILEPLLGAVGKVIAVVVYINILLILLFPIIIPMILTEAALDALEHEPGLWDDLVQLYKEYGIMGLIALGWLIILTYIIIEGYLWQSIIEIGRILLLKDYKINSDGSITINTGQHEPQGIPMSTPKYKGGGKKYKYIFKAEVDDDDIVESNYRDKVQVGWDWDNDYIVDEWTSLSYNRCIYTTHTFSTSGEKEIKYLAKDQWGGIDDWCDAISIFITHPPNKPTITGPSKVKRNDEVSFTAVTEDPEDDNIYYQWKVDRLPVNGGKWYGPYKSGEENGITKIGGFANSGKHLIEVRAKDQHDVIGDWAEFSVTVSDGKSRLINSFNLLDLEKFPTLKILLEKMDWL